MKPGGLKKRTLNNPESNRSKLSWPENCSHVHYDVTADDNDDDSDGSHYANDDDDGHGFSRQSSSKQCQPIGFSCFQK